MTFRRRTVNDLSALQAGYIAGLIDGEGTIALSRKHAHENRQLVVSISSTEKAILEYALVVIGAGKITGKRTARAHHRPGFTFAIGNRQALTLLRQLHPHLQSYKRRRAKLVLANYLQLTPRNGKYDTRMRLARAALELEFQQITCRGLP